MWLHFIFSFLLMVSLFKFFDQILWRIGQLKPLTSLSKPIGMQLLVFVLSIKHYLIKWRWWIINCFKQFKKGLQGLDFRAICNSWFLFIFMYIDELYIIECSHATWNFIIIKLGSTWVYSHPNSSLYYFVLLVLLSWSKL